MSCIGELLEMFGIAESLHRKAYKSAQASELAAQTPSNATLQRNAEGENAKFWNAWTDSRNRYYGNGRQHVTTSVKYYDLRNPDKTFRTPTKKDVENEKARGSRESRERRL